MKTATKKIEVPRLEISYDDIASSPRDDTNLGYFVIVSNRRSSPDDNGGEIYNIVKETADEASDTKDHMRRIKNCIDSLEKETVLAIYPVSTYEHSGIVYSLGSAKGFDYSDNGFYIVTDKTAKELGTPKKSFEKVIAQELELFTKWANGQVYAYELLDEDGEYEDSCGGFYDINDIRESLPEDWKDEDLNQYIK